MDEDSENKENDKTAEGLEKEKGKKDDRVKRREKRRNHRLIMEYYQDGESFGLPSSCMMYQMAGQLGKTDNDLLWYDAILYNLRLSILGLTDQYLHDKMGFMEYQDHVAYHRTEVSKYNVEDDRRFSDLDIDDEDPSGDSVRDAADYNIIHRQEFRLMLLRHWSLYDSMYHSSYVAAKLGIWKEKGRQRLINLLANSGFPLKECHQNYTAMHREYKRDIPNKLRKWAPRYNMPEIEFPSFLKNYGYRLTLSASDAVFALEALMDYGAEWLLKNGAANAVKVPSYGLGQLEAATVGQKLTGVGSGTRTGIAGIGIKLNNLVDDDSIGRDDGTMSEWVKNFYVSYDGLSRYFYLP
jgi:cell division control protein 45